jgi:hypothetical protein
MRKGRIGGDLPLNRAPEAVGSTHIGNAHGAALVPLRPVVRSTD